MLNRIIISGVATYTGEPQQLNNLGKVNFIYGANGSGKTTISRVINDASICKDCELEWDKNSPLDTLVFNSDFIRDNFKEQLRGVFTLGKDEVRTQELIKEVLEKISSVTSDIENRTYVLGADDSKGKRGELRKLRKKFEDLCWKMKKEHDVHFRDAFKGFIKSSARFCEKVLEEAVKNNADVPVFDDLVKRSHTLFSKDVKRFSKLQDLPLNDLLHIENEPILSKKIVAREDLDVASLIKELNNSDWVRQGLHYVDKVGDPCPFCQKPLEAALFEQIVALFDEAYDKDIIKVQQVSRAYGELFDSADAIITDALSSENPFIDKGKLNALLTGLRGLKESNKMRIDEKLKKPSQFVELKSLAEPLQASAAIIKRANDEIDRHNDMVDNLKTQRAQLVASIWRYVVDKLEDDLHLHLNEKSELDKAILGLSKGIDQKRELHQDLKKKLHDLESEMTSIKPTVEKINSVLSSFGFNNFKLKACGENFQYYKIIREDGRDVEETLSEGERNFVAFLYFYNLIEGSLSPSNVSSNRIVVFDDPVSSLDSDVLFVVSSLIKKVTSEAVNGSGQVKQVFILTHNVYFHKEVSHIFPRTGEVAASETYWIVKKKSSISEINSFPRNPISSAYELLWMEVNLAGKSGNFQGRGETIQNTLRRILEYYYTMLGGYNKVQVIEMFSGEDKIMCASLYSWINDGSHHFSDDLNVAINDETVRKFLRIFEQIFEKTGHKAHYEMMMNRSYKSPV